MHVLPIINHAVIKKDASFTGQHSPKLSTGPRTTHTILTNNPRYVFRMQCLLMFLKPHHLKLSIKVTVQTPSLVSEVRMIFS